MRTPPALGPGSRIRVVAPASPPNPVRVQRGIRALRNMGFKVELAPLVRKVRLRGHLAGPDEERAQNLLDAFLDPAVEAIICSNGGTGSLRLLPFLDFDTIAKHPKVLVGFSDITALHVALGQRAGLVTFHGPMASADPDEGLALRWSRDRFLKAVTTTRRLGRVRNPPDGPLLQVVREGRASGPLVGGNLSLVCATLGTPWEIDTRGKVLFLEDWREPPFTLETLLVQLKLAGKLDDAAGIVFGEFVECVPPDPTPHHWIEEVVQDVCSDLSKPVLFGLAAGHGKETATLPMGVRCTVDAHDAVFTVDEPALVAAPSAAERPSRAARRERA